MLELPKLPYELSALEPFISARTLSFHYEKHHAAYVANTNNLIKGTPFEKKSLNEMILEAASDSIYTPLFNNAAQVWNHTFFWNSLTPETNNHIIPDDITQRLISSFGSVQNFKDAFKKAAISQFGSGWAWLVAQGNDLKIMTTSNADTPLTHPMVTPLLCIDVWEHAYYLDYQNLRADFVQNIIDHLLNWRFVRQNLKKE